MSTVWELVRSAAEVDGAPEKAAITINPPPEPSAHIPAGAPETTGSEAAPRVPGLLNGATPDIADMDSLRKPPGPLRRLVRRARTPAASRRRSARFVRKADQARSRRDWPAAAVFYRRALENDPGLTPIWVQYGHALKEEGDWTRAEIAYRRAVALDQSTADTHLQLGHLLKLQRREAEAVGAYCTALLLDRNLVDARHELIQLGYSPSAISGEEVENAHRRAAETDAQKRQIEQEFAKLRRRLEPTERRLAESRRQNQKDAVRLEQLEARVNGLLGDLTQAVAHGRKIAAQLQQAQTRISELERTPATP